MKIGQHYYTWCPRDAGCEGIVGFQTRAKSPLISPEVEQVIRQYCSRYDLPRSLKYLGLKAEDLSHDELRTAPVVVHYYTLSKDLQGLTRICLSAKQTGRPGNFFAHTFVFPREALRRLSFNPFNVLRLGAFKENAESYDKILKDIERFPILESMEYKNNGWLQRYNLHNVSDTRAIQALLACLIAPKEMQRPIILCSPTNQGMTTMIETTLLLLPPEYRPMVTFSTCTPDPYRLLTKGKEVETRSQRIIETIPPDEGGEFQFREDEYQSIFYVFDFCRHRQSDTPPPSKYIQYICAGAERGDAGSINRLHDIIEAVGLAPNTEKWDAVVPAICLMSSEPEISPEEWRSAIQALKAICSTPTAAKVGLELLWKRSQALLVTLPDEITSEVLATCKEFLKIVSSPDAFIREIGQPMGSVLRDLLAVARYHSAQCLLGLSGSQGSSFRREVLVFGIAGAQKLGWPKPCRGTKSGESNTEAFVNLLAEGFAELCRDRSTTGLFANMIEPAFYTAQDMGCLKKTWNHVGQWLLDDGLTLLSPEQALPIVESVSELLMEEGEYDGHRQILLWKLKHAMPPQEERTDFFSKIVTVCRRSAEPVVAADDVLTEAESILGQEDLIPLYVALFATGGDKVCDEVTKHYQKVLKYGADEKTRWEFRRQAASTGGANLLACECSTMLFPWSDESCRTCIRTWIKEVFQSSPETAFAATSAICNAAQRQEDRNACIQALRSYLRELRKAKLGDTGRRLISRVAETLVSSLSLWPLDEQYLDEAIQGVDTETWGETSKALIQVADRIKAAKRLPNSDKPDLVLLLKKNSDLPRILALLEDTAWRQACEWIVSGFHGAYLEDPETVLSVSMLILVHSCAPIESERDIVKPSSGVTKRSSQAGDLLVRKLRTELLEGPLKKDTVTRVRSLAQFVFAATALVPRSDHSDAYKCRKEVQAVEQFTVEHLIAWIIGSVLAEESQTTRRLLWSYVEAHPTLEKKVWDSWLDRFKSEVVTLMRQRRQEVSLISRLSRFGKRLFTREGK